LKADKVSERKRRGIIRYKMHRKGTGNKQEMNKNGIGKVGEIYRKGTCKWAQKKN
jgi:hypothetical protein